MSDLAIVGTGFVADLYMRSFRTFPHIRVTKAYDIDQTRLSVFCKYWNVPQSTSLEELLNSPSPQLILNLTNPNSHFEVSRACLAAGKHVYSEKPLAMNMNDAFELYQLAIEKHLNLCSAPCNLLGEAAQTLWLALRQNQIGTARLVYAELDDGFVPQAPYQNWISESGAPWPFRDEFRVGCTLEHAGYYLSWLIAMFGSVQKVISGSANIIADKLPGEPNTAPDFSSATLFFETGLVARLTCSIIASLNHGMRIFGDKGILEINSSWDNAAPVQLRKRIKFRRKLFNSPLAQRIKIKGPTHPKVKRWGAAAMNFALGPAELIAAIAEGRPSILPAGLALHLTEVSLAIQDGNGIKIMQTDCPPIRPMPWAQIS